MPTKSQESELMSVFVEGKQLPEQIFLEKFGSYMFFDADIGSSKEMLNAIMGLIFAEFGGDMSVKVFSSANWRLLGILEKEIEWGGEISGIGKALRDSGEYGGIILLDSLHRWVAYQSRPVDMGVLAINGSVNVRDDDFFSCQDIASWLEMKTDRDKSLVKGFGKRFLQALIKEYG